MAFPEAGPARDQYILDAVKARAFDGNWVSVASEIPGHKAEFYAMADALKIEGVRVIVSAQLEQQIADMLGASLLTAKLADLVFLQAEVRLAPMPRGITNATVAMIDQSQKIDAAIGDVGDRVVSTVGKHWIIDEWLKTQPNRACNYGWHFVGSSFQGIAGEACASGAKDLLTGSVIRVIQGRGTRHDMHEDDYSQNAVLVQTTCLVDGNELTLTDVLTSDELAPLASHQGKMTILRQPGVPVMPVV